MTKAIHTIRIYFLNDAVQSRYKSLSKRNENESVYWEYGVYDPEKGNVSESSTLNFLNRKCCLNLNQRYWLNQSRNQSLNPSWNRMNGILSCTRSVHVRTLTQGKTRK